MPHGERRQYLGRTRMSDGPYSYPMCGGMDESLHYFLGECERLRDLRLELLDRKVGRRDYILEILKNSCYSDINNIGRFFQVGMRHREDFFE